MTPSLAVQLRAKVIRNAVKHSSGSCVKARLYLESDSVRFSIQDDGQGFDVDQALQTGSRGYSSLQDMRIYVESAGGRLDVRSAPGEGTVVGGELPVRAGQTVDEITGLGLEIKGGEGRGE